MIRKAKQEGGVEFFLACGQAYANPVPASFLIAKGSLGSATDDPLAVVTAIAESAPATFTLRVGQDRPPDVALAHVGEHRSKI
jgi:hypothetical protein